MSKLRPVQREEIGGVAPKNDFRSLIDARWGRIFAINSMSIYIYVYIYNVCSFQFMIML